MILICQNGLFWVSDRYYEKQKSTRKKSQLAKIFLYLGFFIPRYLYRIRKCLKCTFTSFVEVDQLRETAIFKPRYLKSDKIGNQT